MPNFATPRTWASTDALTAALLNQELRDQMLAITAPPMCIAYQNVAQTLTTATPANVTWDAEVIDSTGAMHDNVTNNTRITVPLAGLYLITGQVTFTGNASGVRSIYVQKNGATVIQRNSVGSPSAGVHTTIPFSVMAQLAVNDSVEVNATQNSGGNLALLTTSPYTQCQVRWIGTA